MCGRFLMNEEALNDAMGIAHIPQWVQEELNLKTIYPSNPSLVLIKDQDHLEGDIMEFGFYSDSMKKRIINARAETASQKWMFKRALKAGRCIVVCAKFYEWDADKQMVTFFEDAPAMYLAAIAMEGQFVILTTEANESVSPWHARMPLVLDKQQAKDWVLNGDDTEELLHITPPMLMHQLPPSQPVLF